MNLRILFVEDSADDAELMRRRLREAGIEPKWDRVDTEAALREALAGEGWELALVDYNLPGFGGLQALAVLAAVAPDLPAVTVSGAITEETAVATITAGAVDYVLKDNLTRLAPAVRRAVEDADLRRERRRSAEQARQTMYAIEHSSQAIVYVSEEGVILYANEAAGRLAAVPPAEAIGQTIWGWIPAVDEQRWGKAWRAAAQRPIVDYEAPLRLPGGEARLISATLDYHERGEDSFIIIYARDITEQRAVEERAQASEGMYRRIVEMASEGIRAYDSTHHVVFVNQQAAHMLGYEPYEMVGRIYTDFIFGDDRAQHAAYADAREHGVPGQYEARFKAKDGSEVWLAVNVVADFDAEGAYAGAFAMSTDVTERKQAEEETARTLSLLESTMESTADGILVADGKGGIVRSNARFREMWGIPEAISASKDDDAALDFVLDQLKEPEIFLKAVRELYGAPEEIRFDVLELKDGRVLERYSQPLRIGGSPAGRVWSFRDVTERQQAEDALRESEERFEQFAVHFPGYLYMLNEAHRYVYVNDQPVAEGDVARAQWLGKTPAELWPPEQARAVDEHIDLAMAGEVADLVERWESDSRVEHLHSLYFPIPRGERPPLVGGFSIDVSEQMEAQEDMRRQAAQLRRTVEGAVLAMSRVVETRDPYTAGHERRVSELATAIAAEMGMDGEELTGLRLAGLVHDIGKIAVPAEILAKPGRLSDVELNLIKQHPRSGFDILAAIDFGRPVAEMVLQHHERLDGSGYPRALRGEDILPEARILAVADVVEAMSSHRPYRAALGMEAALAEVGEHAGVKYDAEVVATCIRLVEEKGFELTP